MSSSKCVSNRVAAFVLYLIPLIYSFLVVVFGFIEYEQKRACNLLVLCVLYGVVIILVCSVGCYGIITENVTSIRSTIILLIVNNIIMTMLITFLLIDILNYPHVVTVHRASKFLQFVVQDKKIGLAFCSIVYALIFFSFCFMWTIGDYLAHLDAKLCLDDLRYSHDRMQHKKKRHATKLLGDESEFLIKV
ncbi:conserved Plasmodium protein, unknown function [Plasmodium knowlesi strain H]|uniref:Uncharacterized protein n=3 Tax=Plasmodium knowlesi TaxID=5850 RepID=A0A5K1U8M7_PLAKH|nr:conserved protein, unknown function [Plasmodium knowlesi strain H]OTN63614.1 Uncharacterized protein PKNOH_S140236500 [Plasmodium knowlesi]CAA9990787.1 conserved protein, unknown function [Plasmodium knowlesi strain H]SBO21076.1 conserved Plasmodium protein, unknown function [Plasmodium knowlesi strain H]SBO21556.1 conserved Plasmodium protein, unknown function [Plasmodium knowlesi strain H]VVS80261.1 conserved protein, unknown function [Plasmodium knowlesi strain H]|eukprot:XP_002262076.1 hypothetical protein, conserved in Plasmodium species [Plasmodium knowlesi strain H]